jgi:hypothetical protein
VGIAFPVLDLEGAPHGSIVIAGPVKQDTLKHLVAMVPRFKAIMAELNQFSRLYRAMPPTSILQS